MFVVVLIGCGVNGTESAGGGVCPDIAFSLRDPSSGACHVVTACDAGGNDDPALVQAPCQGFCDSLPEADCISTAGCHRAVLVERNPAMGRFFGCWNIAQPGPIETAICGGLDADGCSRHDTCAAWYQSGIAETMQFDHCADELAYSLASHVDRGLGSRAPSVRIGW
jgi:hypothetical protein